MKERERMRDKEPRFVSPRGPCTSDFDQEVPVFVRTQGVHDEVDVLGHDVDLREVLGLDVVIRVLMKMMDVRGDLEVVLDESVDDTPEFRGGLVRERDRDKVLFRHGHSWGY
jgi:CO dehydrogenase/acetyl-CoA synthase beta subunit